MDKETIRSELRSKGYNISQTAKSLGLDYKDLKDEFGIKHDPIVRPKGPMPIDYQSLGKANMRKFVIAVKPNGGVWPQQFYNAIQDGRRKYDAGTHEMCQGKRKDGWIVLYLIPRVEVRPPRARYFVWQWGVAQ